MDLLEVSHRVFERIDAVVGEQVWNFAEYDWATTGRHESQWR